MEREKQYDVREILQTTKKRKTRLEEMFKALSGGKTDIEAVELSLGRNRPWQASLLKCCADLGAIICNSKVSVRVCWEGVVFAHFESESLFILIMNDFRILPVL